MEVGPWSVGTCAQWRKKRRGGLAGPLLTSVDGTYICMYLSSYVPDSGEGRGGGHGWYLSTSVQRYTSTGSPCTPQEYVPEQKSGSLTGLFAGLTHELAGGGSLGFTG